MRALSRLFGFLAALLVVHPALAVDAAFDTTFGAPGVVYSNSNKTVTGSGYRALVRLDFSAKTMGVMSPGASSFVVHSGGDFSPLGAVALYPAVCVGNSSGIKLHFGSTIQNIIPATYSTWESVAGATTLDPANIGTNISLSGGNLIAIAGASGTNCVRATTAITSGSSNKVVFELEVPNSGGTWGSHIEVGLATAAANFSSIGGITGNSTTYAWWSDSCCTPGWYYNGSGNQTNGQEARLDNSDSNIQVFYRLLKATNAPISSTDKKYFEVTFNTLTGGVVAGFVDSTVTQQNTANIQGNYPGGPGRSSGHSVGFNQSNCFGGAGVISCNLVTFSAAQVVGIAIDGTTGSMWVIHNASGTPTWYGTATGANPATGVNGLTNSFLTAPYYPAVGVGSNTANAGGALTINGGSSPFTYSSYIPAGFSCLTGCTSGRPARGIIFQ